MNCLLGFTTHGQINESVIGIKFSEKMPMYNMYCFFIFRGKPYCGRIIMKIASSDIQMASSRTLLETHEKSENLLIWKGKRPERLLNANSNMAPVSVNQGQEVIADRVTISNQQPLGLESKGSGAEKTCSGCDNGELSDGMDDQVSMMKLLVENMIGRKINIHGFSRIGHERAKSKENIPEQSANNQSEQKLGWGIEYDFHESYTETESTSFSAQGIIQTSDGRKINFTVNLEMSREYSQETSLSYRAGDAVQKDPLVINFTGSAAELTNAKFAFDLDIDGTQDNISFLQPGSGFLVLDNNQDGIVNDGSELFGPGTGDGFSELAKYDEDHNNWIDENDSIYSRLSVWTKNESGTDQLSSLQEKSVGAIYLSNISTLFDLKDSDNQLKGQVAATGIYADEDGSIKTVQHLNIAV
jgi:hypothetical protein